jgi:DNA-binding NtrC family response regulator
VAREALRPDLAARLTGHVLTLPPLRERREDLGLVVAELLHRIDGGEREGRALRPSAARALCAHAWPGNVRELEHVLRAAVASAGAEIALEDLPERLHARPPGGARPAGERDEADRRALIVNLLEKHAGNLSAVARALGTSRSQLRRLGERLGIELGRPKG